MVVFLKLVRNTLLNFNEKQSAIGVCFFKSYNLCIEITSQGVDFTSSWCRSYPYCSLDATKNTLFYFYQNVIINPGTVVSRKMVHNESKKLFRCLLVSFNWQKYCNQGKPLRCRNYPQFPNKYRNCCYSCF